jgi:hypothetical protein
VAERVHLAQAEGSEVGVNPLGLTLAPGEEREVALSLSGFGLLKLALLFGEKRALYLVQVLPEGGSPLPYALQGRLEGSLGQGPPAFRLSLEGPLSREVGVGFLGGTDALRLALRTGPWSGRLSLLPTLGGEVGYREGPHALSLAYPWALEWTYTPGETYRLRLSPTSLALGYADGTFAFGANFPWCFTWSFTGVSFRLERYGEPLPLRPLGTWLILQTIHVSIGFFSAPCKRPSHLRVFTADPGGSAGTFPLVETLGSEAQQQDGLG